MDGRVFDPGSDRPAPGIVGDQEQEADHGAPKQRREHDPLLRTVRALYRLASEQLLESAEWSHRPPSGSSDHGVEHQWQVFDLPK